MKNISVNHFSMTELSAYEFGTSGPLTVITAGIHGDEHTGIHTAHMLASTLQQVNLLGRVRIIPVSNPSAYRNRSRTSPYDGVDMNRIFPGDPNGSITLQTAYAIWNDVQEAETIIDLHCCGIYGSNYVVTLHDEFAHQREMAEGLGFAHVVRSGGARGQLFLEACYAGKKAVLIELKGGQPSGFIDLDSAQLCHDAVIRFLIQQGVLEGEKQQVNPIYFGKLKPIYADRSGFFMPKAAAGSIVQKGDLLATLDGESILSPYTGFLSAIMLPRYCFAGERLARFAPYAENSPE